MTSNKRDEVKSIIKNLDKLKFQLDIKLPCFKTPEHVEAAERFSEVSKLELSEANAYLLLNSTVSQLSSAAYDTGSKIMSFISENTAMLSGSTSQDADLKQNVFISNEELKAESGRITPFNDVEISSEPIKVQRCLMPSKSKRLKKHLKKDILINYQSDLSETASDISSNIKEIESDDEMVAKGADNEIVVKKPDNEMVANEPVIEMVTKEPDNEIVVKEADNEVVPKEPNNEIVSNEPDNEMVANKPVIEMVTKEPDNEIVVKEADNEVVPKEPNNELVSNEPDNEMVAKERDIEMVTNEPDSEMVSKEPGGEMVSKEPGGEMVSKEPDNEIKVHNQDIRLDISSTNNGVNDKIVKEDTMNKRQLGCEDVSKSDLKISNQTISSKDILTNPIRIYMKVNVLKSENELILKCLQVPGSSTIFTDFYLLFTNQYLYVLKKSKEMSIFFTEFLHLSYNKRNIEFLINEEGLVLFSDDHLKYFRINFENQNDKNDILEEISCHFKPKDLNGRKHSLCLKKFLAEVLELSTDKKIQINFYKQVSWLYYQSKEKETLQYQTFALMYKGRNIFGIKWFRFYLISEDGILYHYIDQTSNKPENSWLMSDCSSCQLHDCEIKLDFNSSELLQQSDVRIRFSNKQEALHWYERLKDQMTKMLVPPDEEVICSLLIANDYLVIFEETFPFQYKCFASCRIHQYLNYSSSDNVYQLEFKNSRIWKIKFRNSNYDKQLFEKLMI